MSSPNSNIYKKKKKFVRLTVTPIKKFSLILSHKELYLIINKPFKTIECVLIFIQNKVEKKIKLKLKNMQFKCQERTSLKNNVNIKMCDSK